MQRTRHIVDTALEWLLIVLMGTMTLNVLWQVFSRFVLNSPSSFTEELARYLLVWAGLLGAAYGVGKNVHLAMDLFGHKLSPKTKSFADLFVHACILTFAVSVMLVGGYNLVSLTNTLQQISAALQIKLAYVYFALPLSGALIVFYSLTSIAQSFKDMQSNGGRE